MKCRDAAGRAMFHRPSHGCHGIGATDRAEVRLHLPEFHAVSQHFDLIVDSTQVMEASRFVDDHEVSGAVPDLSIDGGKPCGRAFRILEVTLGHLRTRQRKLPLMAGRKRLASFVKHRSLKARKRFADGYQAEFGSDVGRIREAFQGTEATGLRVSANIVDYAVRSRLPPSLRRTYRKRFSGKYGVAQRRKRPGLQASSSAPERPPSMARKSTW